MQSAKRQALELPHSSVYPQMKKKSFRSAVRKGRKKKNVKFAKKLVYKFTAINKECENMAVIAKEIVKNESTRAGEMA
ncbi:hypothetical protein STEG23_017507 [Scotinomys teguina]